MAVKCCQLTERPALLLQHCCVLLYVGVQASVLQPLVNEKYLEISTV